MAREELMIKPSEEVVYRVDVREGSLHRRYEFEVTGKLVHRVWWLNWNFEKVEVTNFDLQAINAIIQKAGWTLKKESEAK